MSSFLPVSWSAWFVLLYCCYISPHIQLQWRFHALTMTDNSLISCLEWNNPEFQWNLETWSERDRERGSRCVRTAKSLCGQVCLTPGAVRSGEGPLCLSSVNATVLQQGWGTWWWCLGPSVMDRHILWHLIFSIAPGHSGQRFMPPSLSP